MTLRAIFISVVLFAMALCFSCKKEEVLPGVTATGQNTLGCRINGAIWTPRGVHSGKGADMTAGSNSLAINGSDDAGTLLFSVSDTIPIAPKTYFFPNEQYSCYYANDNCRYEPINIVSGKISISRLSNGIVSGTFEFKLYKPECKKDTLRITDGRFDFFFLQ